MADEPVIEIKEAPRAKTAEDSGLGLKSFLTKGGGDTPSPKVEAEEKPKVDLKVDKPTKVDAKPESDAKVDAKDQKPVAQTETAPDFKPNWDDDENPWKKKAGEFDQRYRDTHRNWNQLNQQNQELQRQLTILSKKFDGTYDPAQDEPPPPDPIAYRNWGAIEGKAQASLAAAKRIHGEQKVMAALEEYAQVFANDRGVQERILLSDDPVQGAMDAIEGYRFFTKYGNDPAKIVETMRKQLEEELAPKITERERKAIMDELKNNREPKGIGAVLGGSGATDKQISKENAARPKPLGAMTGFGSH